MMNRRAAVLMLPQTSPSEMTRWAFMFAAYLALAMLSIGIVVIDYSVGSAVSSDVEGIEYIYALVISVGTLLTSLGMTSSLYCACEYFHAMRKFYPVRAN